MLKNQTTKGKYWDIYKFYSIFLYVEEVIEQCILPSTTIKPVQSRKKKRKSIKTVTKKTLIIPMTRKNNGIRPYQVGIRKFTDSLDNIFGYSFGLKRIYN